MHLLDITIQKVNFLVQTSYKKEKNYSKTVKKVLAFYITSWYIIFTPEMGGGNPLKANNYVFKNSNIRRRTT